MALEEPKKDDTEVAIGDFKFTVEDGIGDTFDALTVDYSDSWMKRGFSVVPGSSSGGITGSC